MRKLLELAQFLGLREAERQVAVVQKRLCLRLFNEPNPDRINIPLEFLRREVPLNAFSLGEEDKVRYYADSLKSLCDLGSTIEPLKNAIDYLDALQEAKQNEARHSGLLSHNNHNNLLMISKMRGVIEEAIRTG